MNISSRLSDERSRSSYWDKEEVLFDGDQYGDRVLEAIDQAKELITVEIYIFNDDSLGKKIAAHLIQAKKRGVKVQIIVDGVGSYGFFDKLAGVFKNAGIQIKMFHPLPLYHSFYGNIKFTKKISAFFYRIWRMNQRNHRKIITIDYNTMYAGSFNFTAEHTRYHSEKKWKDMGVRVCGENVKLAILQFKKVWGIRGYLRYRKQVKYLLTKQLKLSPLRLNHTLFMKRYYYRDLLQKINKAQKRIWIVTPYFIPKRRLIRVIGKAAQRGVDVRLLISSRTDVKIFQTLQFFYYPYLLKKGVKIFQYTETVLHAKNFIIDDWITIGSSNLNHRSFLHDLEVDLAVQDQKNKEIIEEDFKRSTPSELELTTQHLKQRTLFDKFLSRLFFVFKYWF